MSRPEQKSSVIVIGAGLGGLAAACTMAARGHKVTVLEANDWLGGKAAEWREGGYRFDMGPTILTVPRVLERVFSEAGVDMHERLDLRRLDPQWRCFFEDGQTLDLEENAERMSQVLENLCAGDGDGYRDLMETSRQLHETSERFFFWKSVGGIADTMDLRSTFTLATLRDVLRLRMDSTFAREIRKRIHNPQAAQMLDHLTQYVGSNPFQAPAVLLGIADMQSHDGVWYPMGGTRAVPEALVRLGEELGAEFRTGVRVQRILTRNGRACGVLTAEGDVLEADVIISNMDSVRTMRELLAHVPSAGFERKWKRRRPACSGVVLYLGLDRTYDHLAHHDFVFSADPEEEFDAIYRRGVPAPDPTCYLAAPSRTDPDVAPEGGEALYVLVHTPYIHRGQNWQEMFPGYRQVILDKLKRCGRMPDLEERIRVEHHLTPLDIQERYSTLRGAIYGLASHGRLNGAFKPANRSTDVSGLYLAGGSAHPGAGMPMALMSGWIAADCADHDMAEARAS
ncbi:phytoene desaturase family protein [Gluconobacter roseus]|uniref:Phytoene desaturase n=1 Tax=Gluconobacter roseus NBRC 3990 TaxID=1307950 RepID=A0A4Y3M5N8_9PROT|nr:phytoene desaturase family protein [Gluconobacter roseus]KXV43664.1 phytoene desaturase [Gluconobacter roseus]GBR47393.1 phytoene dehydrogenase [Gluconobacter roseus NBRC 3990]GEB04570.1 phytoene desaturase [Gluconobacter roseus NBRC 3990]GLP92295.1 phytoene desaturase [Gluconobacter roseus NBRC 3990]